VDPGFTGDVTLSRVCGEEVENHIFFINVTFIHSPEANNIAVKHVIFQATGFARPQPIRWLDHKT